jgi:hypothetical protein
MVSPREPSPVFFPRPGFIHKLKFIPLFRPPVKTTSEIHYKGGIGRTYSLPVPPGFAISYKHSFHHFKGQALFLGKERLMNERSMIAEP